jgi:hypothetical protein
VLRGERNRIVGVGPRGEIQFRDVDASRMAAARLLEAAAALAETGDPGCAVVPGAEAPIPPEAAPPASEVDEPLGAPGRGSSGVDGVETAGAASGEVTTAGVVGAGSGGGLGTAGVLGAGGSGGGLGTGGSGGGLGAGDRGGNSSAAAGPAMPPAKRSAARSPQRLT